MGARLGRLRSWACLYIAQRRQFGSKFNLIWELLHIFRWGEASMEFWVKLSIIMYRSQLKCFSWSELNFLRWMNLQSRRSENYDSTKRPEQWNPSRYSSAVIGNRRIFDVEFCVQEIVENHWFNMTNNSKLVPHEIKNFLIKLQQDVKVSPPKPPELIRSDY